MIIVGKPTTYLQANRQYLHNLCNSGLGNITCLFFSAESQRSAYLEMNRLPSLPPHCDEIWYKVGIFVANPSVCTSTNGQSISNPRKGGSGILLPVYLSEDRASTESSSARIQSSCQSQPGSKRIVIYIGLRT